MRLTPSVILKSRGCAVAFVPTGAWDDIWQKKSSISNYGSRRGYIQAMEAPLLRTGRSLRPLNRLFFNSTHRTSPCQSRSGAASREFRRNYRTGTCRQLLSLSTRQSAEVKERRQYGRRKQSDHSRTVVSADAALKNAHSTATGILEHSSIPSETETVDALKAIESAARQLVNVHNQETQEPEDDNTPASALLSLDGRSLPSLLSISQPLNHTIDGLSDLAHRVIIHPSVFITPDVLSAYISIQALLLRPQTLPEAFDLFAAKPAPFESKSTPGKIQYKKQNIDAIASAAPAALANTALTAAIAVRNLPLALSIINTTFQTRAFRRSKIFRQALPPLFGASLAPIAAYALASQLSLYQTALDPESFTSIAFAGMFTYVAAVGTIGVVALTTANDQMERVTWAVGMPLRERWVREEERAAVDRIAAAWGFREKWKWGEEEGEEWEALREWIGVRGMVLDKVGLMEGME